MRTDFGTRVPFASTFPPCSHQLLEIEDQEGTIEANIKQELL